VNDAGAIPKPLSTPSSAGGGTQGNAFFLKILQNEQINKQKKR
jgi:hypothetical protein